MGSRVSPTGFQANEGLARAYSPFDPDAGTLRTGCAVLERVQEFTKAVWISAEEARPVRKTQAPGRTKSHGATP